MAPPLPVASERLTAKIAAPSSTLMLEASTVMEPPAPSPNESALICEDPPVTRTSSLAARTMAPPVPAATARAKIFPPSSTLMLEASTVMEPPAPSPNELPTIWALSATRIFVPFSRISPAFAVPAVAACTRVSLPTIVRSPLVWRSMATGAPGSEPLALDNIRLPP